MGARPISTLFLFLLNKVSLRAGVVTDTAAGGEDTYPGWNGRTDGKTQANWRRSAAYTSHAPADAAL